MDRPNHLQHAWSCSLSHAQDQLPGLVSRVETHQPRPENGQVHLAADSLGDHHALRVLLRKRVRDR